MERQAPEPIDTYTHSLTLTEIIKYLQWPDKQKLIWFSNWSDRTIFLKWCSTSPTSIVWVCLRCFFCIHMFVYELDSLLKELLCTPPKVTRWCLWMPCKRSDRNGFRHGSALLPSHAMTLLLQNSSKHRHLTNNLVCHRHLKHGNLPFC